MESLLIKRLRLIVNTSTDVWHPRVTGRNGDAFARPRSSRFGLCL